MLDVLNNNSVTDVPLIRNLILKAQNNSIRKLPDASIDWSLNIEPPTWLTEEKYVHMISNLIYGERATVSACRLLQSRFGVGAEYGFLETQIVDELHHAEIYSRYLALLGQKESPSQDWCLIIEDCLEQHTSEIELILAFHILLEGEAVFLQKLIGDYIPCPLFSNINNQIRLDEARHLAFGKIMLPHLVSSLNETEKRNILIWAKNLWFQSAHILVAEYLDLSMGKSFIVNQLLKSRWKKQKAILSNLGLS